MISAGNQKQPIGWILKTPILIVID